MKKYLAPQIEWIILESDVVRTSSGSATSGSFEMSQDDPWALSVLD